jgi:hypothetical protein
VAQSKDKNRMEFCLMFIEEIIVPAFALEAQRRLAGGDNYRNHRLIASAS